MSYQSRTISRIITSTAAPTWVSAMTLTNRLYEAGTNLPSTNEAKLVWPNGTWPSTLYSDTPSGNAYGHRGYNCTLHLEDVGAYGTWVTGNAGEDQLMGQSQRFNLSENNPTWDIWEQPTFCTTLAQATAADADFYYSPTDYAALPTANKIPLGSDGGYASWLSTWQALSSGSQFPAGFRNWVYWRRPTTLSFGNNRPMGWRYNSQVYVPPSMTGTGAGAILQNQHSHVGPFSTWKPTGTTDAQFCSDLHASGRRRWYVHAQNTQTRAFTRLANPMPDTTSSNHGVFRHQAIVDRTLKRVYYQGVNGGNNAVCYLDLSAGLAGATWSSWTALTNVGSGSWATAGFAQQSGHAYTDGHPTGKRLWFQQCDNIANSLWMIDLATNSLYQLRNLPGMSIDLTDTLGNYDCNAHLGMTYDSVANKVIMTTYSPAAIKSIVFTVPSDPTLAANYSCTTTTLTAAPGVTLETLDNAIFPYQDRCKLLRFGSLNVILQSQKFGRMLAYRPY